MTNAIIEIQYFPPVSYFSVLARYRSVIIESMENYQKQSYRNRCRIMTASKVDDLIVPVIKGKSKIPIKEIRIDHSQKWINRHWRAIRSGYGKSPFFEHYENVVYQLISEKHEFLFEKNVFILKTFINLLELNTELGFNRKYEIDLPVETDDFRNVIHPKSIPGYPSFFRVMRYLQLFNESFVPNLSILDLLFCEGPNANKVINSSIGL